METEQELNKKLSGKLNKFAGFQWLKATDGEYHWFDADKNIVSPSDERGNIIWDMNACFKWLVPKFMEAGYGYVLSDSCGEKPHLFTLYSGYKEGEEKIIFSASAETPALALCLAIEKLIGDKDV